MIEVDKTYTTKFATKERFTVKRIQFDKSGKPNRVFGIFENSPHLEECPLGIERLIDPDENTENDEIKICKSCNRPL